MSLKRVFAFFVLVYLVLQTKRQYCLSNIGVKVWNNMFVLVYLVLQTKRQYCLSNIGVKVWNNLNENIKSYDNLSSFKRALKDRIINLT